jgi:hypothetical protein
VVELIIPNPVQPNRGRRGDTNCSAETPAAPAETNPAAHLARRAPRRRTYESRTYPHVACGTRPGAAGASSGRTTSGSPGMPMLTPQPAASGSRRRATAATRPARCPRTHTKAVTQHPHPPGHHSSHLADRLAGTVTIRALRFSPWDKLCGGVRCVGTRRASGFFRASFQQHERNQACGVPLVHIVSTPRAWVHDRSETHVVPVDARPQPFALLS